ncbi:CpmJ protein [Sodalis sp. dw_96]|uniref:carbapenem self-resistance protein CarG family protein n=1 Tax=Sodalis sp. dw_96 TaxID=2719794 RepID=UPI001BD2B7AD|nr:CpmJ protein [Sodalis sp. dw_96]
MKNSFLAGLLFFSFHIYADPLVPVALTPGANVLDINNDGCDDYIMLGQFDNNTAFPNRGMSFFIRKPDGGFSIVPVANNDYFIWFDYWLSASAIAVADTRLYRAGSHYYLVSAHKIGDDLSDTQPVSFNVYQLNETHHDPGMPLYSWQVMKTFSSSRPYLSVEQAFSEVEQINLSP